MFICLIYNYSLDSWIWGANPGWHRWNDSPPPFKPPSPSQSVTSSISTQWVTRHPAHINKYLVKKKTLNPIKISTTRTGGNSAESLTILLQNSSASFHVATKLIPCQTGSEIVRTNTLHHTTFSTTAAWSNGLVSINMLLIPPWHFWRSSGQVNRLDREESDREMNRIASSKTDSSQGITNGPWFAKPNSSSAWTSRLLRIGWFRYDARTTNLLQLLPTQTATCPDGTSDGTQRLTEDKRALLRHRRSICLRLTMWRILLHFTRPPAIVLSFFIRFSQNWSGKGGIFIFFSRESERENVRWEGLSIWERRSLNSEGYTTMPLSFWYNYEIVLTVFSN